MDITKKLKSFVVRQGARSPNSPPEAVLSGEMLGEPTVIKEKEDGRDTRNDPIADAEILQCIESCYYSDDTFDSRQYELQKFTEPADLPQIHATRQCLRKQLHVVSKKISDLILQNQAAYAQELHRVTELQTNLEHAGMICLEARRQLAGAKRDFTTLSLGILASYRKRELLRSLLRSLYMIKTLQETDVRLRELLEEEDYPGAIQLCLECQKAASTFRHYHCISELSSKLQDTLEMTEEQLDVALSKVCTNFDTSHYEKLQAAYRLLGKVQTAMDQLLMHFASAIHNKAFMIVLGYVELCVGSGETNFQKRQYFDLCKFITVESFMPCLTDLCKALWEVLRSYWHILEWHEEHDDQLPPTEEGEPSENATAEDTIGRRYVRQKLEHGLLRIWQDVQQKVKAFLLASDLSSFKFDDFIRVLDLVRRLIVIGEEFCGSKSEDLQESLRKQTVNYFRNYHRGCMEELRMFLENESWELCPVRTNFTILQLQEFRFLRQSLALKSHATPLNSPEHIRLSRQSSSTMRPVPTSGYFRQYHKQGNPFDIQIDEDENEDVLAYDGNDDCSRPGYNSDSDEDLDIADDTKKDYVDEQTEDAPNKRLNKASKRYSCNMKEQTPILTNTTLNVLRLFGKYMQMMDVLNPIAFDVLICMSHLFDYYMYAVFLFFAKEMSDISENSLGNKLRTALRRITETVVMVDEDVDLADSRNKDKVPPPSLSPVVELRNSESLHGLAQRIAAAESLVFLADQFEFLHPHLEALIPTLKKTFLQQFCSQTVAAAAELRRPVYMMVSSRAINFEQVLNLMSAVKWDIHEIMSQHSYYVDVLLRELQVFSMRLVEIMKQVPIPKEAHDMLWEHCIRLANRTFVEGFSQAKKCTNEGRALMQLDYQQFLSKVERVVELRPIPERELVEGYIKSCYLLEPALEQWIRTHKEYTSKQLLALINCVTQINKKGRQKLINLIEEGDRTKR